MKKTKAAAKSKDAPLPKEVLRIPLVQDLLRGKPAAVGFDSAAAQQNEEMLNTVIKNADALSDYGILPYVSKDKQSGAIYNATLVAPEDIAAADAEGKLFELAPLLGGVADAGGAAAPVATGGGAARVPPAPAAVQRTRTSSAAQNSTFDGPKPGTGWLNRISKPMV